MNGEIINYTNIAKDTGVDVKTVQSYFQILIDTHLGFFLNPLKSLYARLSARAQNSTFSIME